MSIISDLNSKNINVENLAEKALNNNKILSELLEGILSKDDALRYNSFNVLLLISETHPEILYPKWEFFVDLINSYNSYRKLIAIRIIANLVRIDKENKFEKIFSKYYSILDGEKTMTAAHLAANSGKIAKAKPQLRPKITTRLLNIDKTHQGKQKELIKGYVIEAFDQYFEEAENQSEMIEFVKKQLNSDSPKTRKIAEEFLERWNQ